jgi:predicted TIM-barrel fold metal-dependent hydrolase
MSVTEMGKQVAVMERISTMKNRPFAMQGYVAFDPCRQALLMQNGTTTLDPVVQNAILHQGFIGVKVYPPMGFLAIGNALLSDFPPLVSASLGVNCGRMIDEALMVLYDWCVQEDVPILTHCGRSNLSRPDYGDRPSPEVWQKVLQAYPKLRLNLGHAGGLPEYAEYLQQGGDGDDWLQTVLAMLPAYPNLYADVAFDYIVLDRDSKESKEDSDIAGFLKIALTDSGTANKIMYGSDWVMFDMEYGNAAYYSTMKQRFGEILGDDLLVKFLKQNAASFLGLRTPGSVKTQARQRLDSFYAANGLDTSILDRLGA